MEVRCANVRFTPQSGHGRALAECLLSAKSGSRRYKRCLIKEAAQPAASSGGLKRRYENQLSWASTSYLLGRGDIQVGTPGLPRKDGSGLRGHANIPHHNPPPR
jgi:hypothetical protein